MQVSNPLKASASQALGTVRNEKDVARKGAVAAEAFDQVAQQVPVHDTAATCATEMARAAAAATPDREARLQVHIAGLEALAGGVTGSVGSLSRLATALLHAQPKKAVGERVAVFNATMQAMARLAPDASTREKADLMRTVATAAPTSTSALAAAEKALGAVGFGDSTLGRLAARLVPQAFSLRALASKMARQGIHDDSRDDRRPMARAAVQFLAAPEHGGDAISGMADRAIGAMRFSDTAGTVALDALSNRPLSWRAVLSNEAPTGPDALGDMGAAFVHDAFMGSNRGQWVDEKAAVAQQVLGTLAKSAPTEEARAFASTARAIVHDVSFSRSSAPVAEVALGAFSRSPFSDRDLARTFGKMMAKALATDSTAGAYKDDKSVVARHAAAYFANHGSTPEARKWGSLMAAVLAPVKFTESNVALAQQGLAVIASGRPADDRQVARVLGRMIHGALNTGSAAGRYQADKSTTMRAAFPWLEDNLTDDASRRVLDMWKAAVGDATFAVSAEHISREATSAIAEGRADDRAMGRLALRMTAAAHAGESAASTYVDDKTGVALRTAEMLAKTGVEASTREWAGFLQKSLDRVAFTRTAENLAPIVFEAIADGKPTDGAAMARLGARLVDKALATDTSRGQWHDDKQRVGKNVAEALVASKKLTPGAEQLAQLLHDALGACRLSPSIPKLASVGLAGVASPQEPGRSDIARVATDMVRAGASGNGRQDQGPIAAALAGSLASGSTDFASTQEAFLGLQAMMNTGVDHRERVKAFEKGLALMAGHDVGQPLEPLEFVLEAASGTPVADAQRDMLVAALAWYAKGQGGDIEADTVRAISKVRSQTPEQAVETLRTFARDLARRPKDADMVKRMAEALESATPKEAGTIEQQEEYVVIGGVRIRKQTSA